MAGRLGIWSYGLAAVLLWMAYYVAKAGIPLHHAPKWNAYFDQAWYVRSANAFAAGDLARAEHWYPLLYPLVAAPFAWVLPNDPFFLPDALLYGLTAVAFIRTLRHLKVDDAWSAAIFVLTTLTLWRFAKLWIEPWTTTLSAALIWWLLAIIGDVVLGAGRDERPSGIRDRHAVAIGALAGALPLVRPTDALVSAVMLLFVCGWLHHQKRLSVRALALLAAGAVAVIGPYLALHVAIYGWTISDYERAAALQGFTFGDLPWKIAIIVVSPRPWYPDGLSLFEGLPAILPGLAGLGVAAAAMPRAGRRLLALAALVAVPYCAVFLAYTDLQPPGIWQFSNAHYFKWLFPLLTAGCLLLIRAFLDRRRVWPAIGALAIVLIPTCLRPLPVRVDDREPARMLLFRGDTTGFWRSHETTKAWERAYFRPAQIVDARGTLVNVGRFHQVPDHAGERAIATMRLFAADARRIDAGDAAPFRGPEPPYARYGVRLSVGVPCWLSRKTCERSLGL